MVWMRHNGGILKVDGRIAVDPACCCFDILCCNRELPQTLYLEIENIPVGPDPLPPFGFSSCCADGARIPLTLCQYIPASESFQGGPNIWGGSGEWCSGATIYAEWQCGLPGGSECEGAGDVLRLYIDDDCDDQFQSGSFVCDDISPTTIIRSLTSSDRIECECGDGITDFFRYVYQTNALFGQCCNNMATNGPRLNWTITEL